MQSELINDLVGAMNRAQLKMQPARKDKENPFFKSHYADLPAVWDALQPFREEGLVFTQSPSDSPDGYIVLDTQITHTSGQWMRSRLKMRLTKDDPQGAGSALTYARRYALGCMSGLVTEEDDDGNAASDTSTPHSYAQKFTAPAAPKALVHPQPIPAQDGAFLVPFGKNKGKQLAEIADTDVDYLLAYYKGKLNDPAQSTSRYREEWESCLAAIQAEIMARYPLLDGEPA